MKNSRKLLFLCLSAITALLVTFSGGYFINEVYKSPQQQAIRESQEDIIFTLRVESTEYKVSSQRNTTLFDSLSAFDMRDESFSFSYTEYDGIGKFITAINDVSANPSNQFWELQVNGIPAQSGVSEIMVEPETIYSFKLTTF